MLWEEVQLDFASIWVCVRWEYHLYSLSLIEIFSLSQKCWLLFGTIFWSLFYHNYPKLADTIESEKFISLTKFFPIGWRHRGGQHKGWASHYNKVEIIVLAIFLPVIGQFFQILCSHWLKWNGQVNLDLGLAALELLDKV